MKIGLVCAALALVASTAALGSTDTSGDVTRTWRGDDAAKVMGSVRARLETYTTVAPWGGPDSRLVEGLSILKKGDAHDFLYVTHSHASGNPLALSEVQRVSQWCVRRPDGREAVYLMKEDLEPAGTKPRAGWDLVEVRYQLKAACPTEA
jgi:hypothetical protein